MGAKAGGAARAVAVGHKAGGPAKGIAVAHKAGGPVRSWRTTRYDDVSLPHLG